MDWGTQGEGEASVEAMAVGIKEGMKQWEGGLESTEVAGVLGTKLKLEGSEGKGEEKIVATWIMEAIEGLEGTWGEEKF